MAGGLITQEGCALRPGQRGNVIKSGTYSAATKNSEDYLLIEGGGLIIWLEVTTIGSGVVTDVNLQAKVGSSYVTIAAFGSLAISANGVYGFRVAPGAQRAAGGSAYKGAAEDQPASQGRVQVISTTGDVVYNVRIEALEN